MVINPPSDQIGQLLRECHAARIVDALGYRAHLACGVRSSTSQLGYEYEVPERVDETG